MTRYGLLEDILEAATRHRGRPPIGAEPTTNRQAQAKRKAKLEKDGGRISNVALSPAAAASCTRLRSALDLKSDRAALEVAVLWCSRSANLAELVKKLRRQSLSAAEGEP